MKAQGATEYLVLIGVALFIATLVVVILAWPTGTTKDMKTSQSDIKCGIAKNAVPDIMQGMVAYYKFDEASGTLAYDRKTGASGTLTNGPAWVIGKSGTALEFDGVDDFVNISDSSSLSFTNNAFTISFWMKVPSTSTRVAALSKGGGGSQYEYTAGELTSRCSSLSFVARTLGGSNVYVSDSITCSAGEWVHFAWVADGATSTIYRNSASVSTASKSASNMGDGTGILRIGASGPSVVQYHNGTIDEVLIYNRALSSDEIKYLFEYPGCP